MERADRDARLKVVEAPEDCGNAPRKMVIRDLLVALAERDHDAVVPFLREDIRWEIVGAQELTGLDAVGAWLAQQPPVEQLHIATVMTHGTDCGADGRLVHSDGSTTRFNHVLLFAGHAKTAKLKAVRSYLIVQECR